MRTAAATYRATSLEILKQLSVGPGSGGTHYVRCIRSDLSDNPKGFHTEVIRQQLRALAILDTAKARQSGFSSRIPFAEFIRRYKNKIHILLGLSTQLPVMYNMWWKFPDTDF